MLNSYVRPSAIFDGETYEFKVQLAIEFLIRIRHPVKKNNKTLIGYQKGKERVSLLFMSRLR